MHALLVANGIPPSEGLLRELAATAGLIVAADGGADAAIAAGIHVDAIVGDLDSASASARELLGEARLFPDRDINRTDLQKALEHCLDRGCDAIDIVAGGGGRADHALANLSVLSLYRGRARVALIDDLFEISLVDGSATINAPPGTVISLVAIGTCDGVTTSGLRWDLHDYSLRFSPYGVHNEVAQSPATVSVRSGDLLLFRGRWIEKHA
jgi:thiamine pyrophosphokinase